MIVGETVADVEEAFVKSFGTRIGVLAVVVSLAAAACGSSASSAGPASPASYSASGAVSASPAASPAATAVQPVTLTFWKPTWGTDDKYLPPLFKQFEAEHPGVTINYLFGSWSNTVQQYTTGFLSGSPPDVMYMPDEIYPIFASSNQLAPLDNFADLATVKQDYAPQWWDPGTYNGHTWGIPYVHVGVSIVYNKALFDKAGLSYPPGVNDPNLSSWTWANFLQDAQKLTNASTSQVGFAWAGNWTGCPECLTYNFVKEAGDNILNDAGTAVAFDNPAGLQAFQFMNSLVTSKVVPAGGMDPKFQDNFLNGQAAMAPFDVYDVLNIAENHPNLNVGVAPWPQGPGTQLLGGRGMHANVGFLLMAAQSKNKDLDWDLIKFLTSKANSEAYLNATGLFGCRNDSALQLPNATGQQLTTQVLAMTTKYGYGYAPNPKNIDIATIFTAEVQNMLQGNKTPEQAWKDAVSEMNAKLQP